MTSPQAVSGTPAITGPLRGLKVLELGHFIAAPFCTRLLADHGANVIKVEPPTGEPLRTWGAQTQGTLNHLVAPQSEISAVSR